MKYLRINYHDNDLASEAYLVGKLVTHELIVDEIKEEQIPKIKHAVDELFYSLYSMIHALNNTEKHIDRSYIDTDVSIVDDSEVESWSNSEVIYIQLSSDEYFFIV